MTMRTTLSFMLVLSSMLAFCTSCGQSPSAPAASAELGTLQVIKGTATLVHGAATSSVAAGARAPVSAGDTVSTGPDSEAIVLSAKQVHMLSPGSKFQLETPSTGEGIGRIKLLEGIATFILPPNPVKKSPFEAAANSVVAAVKGTIFRMEIAGTGVKVTVARGEVEVRPDAGAPAFEPVLLKAGTGANASAGKAEVVQVAADALNKIRTEILERKQHLGTTMTTF